MGCKQGHDKIQQMEFLATLMKQRYWYCSFEKSKQMRGPHHFSLCGDISSKWHQNLSEAYQVSINNVWV